MRDRFRPQALTRSRRARPLAVAALVSGVLAGGCGGGSPGPPPATVGDASSSTSTTASAATAGAAARADSAAPSAGIPNALEFAKCMRSGGVPDFPDPLPGGGFLFNAAAINRGAPAVLAAQAKCQRFAPHPPSGPSPGSASPHTTARALAQLRAVARCMRQHGISQFPDPKTTPPPNLNPADYSNITNYEGVFILFPATIDMQSPAWQQAAAACGPLAESFNHPHGQ